MSDWQPIETAPKDGTHIDIWAKRWRDDSYGIVTRRFTDCCWNRGDSMTGRREFWNGMDDTWYPTHWMPVPEPPKDSQ